MTRSRSLATPPAILHTEMIMLPTNSACISTSKTIERAYHACQIVCAPVSKELPCRRERANSKGPFAVAMTTGELIVGHQTFLWFA